MENPSSSGRAKWPGDGAVGDVMDVIWGRRVAKIAAFATYLFQAQGLPAPEQ